MEFLLVAGVWAIVLGGVGWWIAQQKNRSEVEGAALGCFLGPIGWIIEAVLPTGEAPTPTGRSSGVRAASVPRESPPPPRPATRRPKFWEFAMDPLQGTGDAATERALEKARLIMADRTARGDVLVEAVWQRWESPRLGLAFGDEGATYDRMWPEGHDIAKDLLPRASDPGPLDAPDGVPDESEIRDTKTCPDCAETILAAARICRYCRYEFWPADTPPPTTPVDVPDDAGILLTPEAPTPPDEMPETQVEVAATDAAPTEPRTDAPQPDEPPQPDRLVVESPPPAPERQAWTTVEREMTPPAPPPPPYAPPAPPWAARPPTYPPQRPPYAPPPPGWQPPQGQPPGQVPPGPGPSPWPSPPDRPRQ